MSYAIIGLVFLLLVVFAVLSAKSWHWINIVFLILTFIAGVGACAGLSQVMKLRSDLMKNADRQEERRIRLEAQANEAVVGAPDSIEFGRDSLRGINELLTQEMAGRGRVWTSGQVSEAAANRVFQFAAARPADDVAANKMQDMVLYAFADGQVAGQMAPYSYVGTVRVVKESPDQLELEPVFIANVGEYNQIQSSWSLFEKMPNDRRDIFKKVENITDDNFDVDAYRATLMTNYLPRANFSGLSDAEYERLIDRYAFDGMSLATINQWLEANAATRHPDNLKFEPDLQEEFVLFRFDKKSDPIQVDASNENLETDGIFTNRGLAVDYAIRAGGPVVFNKDDTILIDRRTAEGYQLEDNTQIAPFNDRYDVTRIESFYFRKLQDFPFLLADLDLQSKRLVAETQRIAADNVVTQTAFENAEDQVTERQTITSKLEQDNQNLTSDKQVIVSLHDTRNRELQAELERARILELEIRKRYAEIISKSEATKPKEKVASK